MDHAKRQASTLEFTTLSPYYPRRFVPTDANLGSLDTIRTLYQSLLDRPADTPEAMEQWILQRSELEAAIGQYTTILYIRMTCQTDDPQRAVAYTEFIEQIHPVIKTLSHELDAKMIQAVDRLSFQSPRYALYFKTMRADIELFCEDNIPLQTKDELLSQQYQTVTGAMTVHFDGQELPISTLRKYFYESDRGLRERAWKAYFDRYQQDGETLDGIFDQMVSVRHRIAQQAGFADYRDYKFKEYHRFDYTPRQCRQYHEAVETHLVPVLRQMHHSKAEQMGLTALRPWDLVCDPLGRPPLKPAEDLDQLTKGLQTLFYGVDPAFGQQFEMMLTQGLLDLESRKGKAPGGYQATLHEARKPFIFGNAIGADADFQLLAHEGGHAFHLLACADEQLTAYLQAPIEFCEVASMSMELLAAAHLEVFYTPDQQAQWWRDKLESHVRVLVQVAVFDAFQHWIYEHPSASISDRQQQWIAVNDRFETGRVDWSGLDAYRRLEWHRVPHFFQCPLYYIEYGIAQLGALGIWMQAKEDRARAVGHYKTALALGGSRPLPELFAAAGLEFDFSEKTLERLSAMLFEEWQRYR